MTLMLKVGPVVCRHSDFSCIVVSVSADSLVGEHRLFSCASLSSHTGDSAVRSPWMAIMPNFSRAVEAFALLIAWPSAGRFSAVCSQQVALAGGDQPVALSRSLFSGLLQQVAFSGWHACQSSNRQSSSCTVDPVALSALSACSRSRRLVGVLRRTLVLSIATSPQRRARTITSDS